MEPQPFQCTWDLQETDHAAEDQWHIRIMACRAAGQEALGYGWTAMGDESPTATAVFDQSQATAFLKALHTTVVALHDPADYLRLLGIPFGDDLPAPPTAVIGSARGTGGIQIIINLSAPHRFAEVSIYPADPKLPSQSCAVVDVRSVVALIQVTEAAFQRLGWPLPE